MKRQVLSLLILTVSMGTFAQNVGIGNTSFTPDASSVLELRSSSTGFLMPRMTEAQRDAISSPATGLMIYQTNNTPGYYYYDGSSWSSFGASIDNLGDHTATQNLIVGTGLGVTDTDEDTKIQVEASADEDRIRFSVGGSEAMIIDDAQNVGVGTSSPTEKLHVEGNVRVGSNAYLDDDATPGGDNDDWIRLNGYVEVKSNSDNYGLVVRDKDNSEYLGITQKNGWSYFADNSNSGSYFLRGSGADVEIRGDLNVRGSDVYDNSGDIRLSGEDNVYITMDHNNNDNNNRAIRFGKNSMTSPTELMRIEEGGNVGIGTTTPSSLLDVAGTMETQSLKVTGGAANGYVLTSDASGNATWQAPASGSGNLADNDNDTKIQVEESADEDMIRFDVAGSEAMIIDDNGNVGVGTSSPTKNLQIQVSNNGLNLPVFLRNTNGSNGNNGVGIGFNSEQNGNWVKAAIFHERTGGFGIGKMHFLMDNAADNGSVSLSQSRMTINYNGDIGIGTTNPGYKLHLYQNNTGAGDNIVEVSNQSSNGLAHFAENTQSNNNYNTSETWTNMSNSSGTPFGILGGSYSSSNGSTAGGVYGHANNRRGYGVLGVRSGSGGSGYAGLFLGKLGYTGGLANLSDRRLKRDIEDLDNALEIVKSLRATTYYFDTDKHADFGLSETLQYGFIVQELEEVLPEIVMDAQLPGLAKQRGHKDSMEDVQVETFKSYDFPQLIPILTKAIQEQQDIIEEMDAKNQELEARLAAIEAKLK